MGAGGKVGASNHARGNAKKLWEQIKRPNENSERFFHGAGSRYIEKDTENLAERCMRFLPNGAADPYDIRPNYDLEMDLLGWFDSQDQSGGNMKELVFEGTDNDDNPIYSDNRRKQKYYRKNSGKWLNAFEPEYL